MSFGENLQFLRKMRNKMTQEDLAEKINVSRQTISKWELNLAYPEIEKTIQLAQLFSCSIDDLLLRQMAIDNDSYTEITVKMIPAFQYVKHAVISTTPEDDAMNHLLTLVKDYQIIEPKIIGWDYPFLSQEQINVFHMHGYEAALIIDQDLTKIDQQIFRQKDQKYAVITIKDPFISPFTTIPNAYKTLSYYIEINGHQYESQKEVIPCFERVYENNHQTYMDVCIAITE